MLYFLIWTSASCSEGGGRKGSSGPYDVLLNACWKQMVSRRWPPSSVEYPAGARWLVTWSGGSAEDGVIYACGCRNASTFLVGPV